MQLKSWISHFQTHIKDIYHEHFLWNCPQVNATRAHWCLINSLRPRQNGRLFADDTFKCIFLNKNIRISTKNSPKFVSKGLINNIPALVLIMAWRRPGDKPLFEPMLVRSLTHICVTRPQWVNIGSSNGFVPSANEPLSEPIMTQFYDAIWHHQATVSYQALWCWIYFSRNMIFFNLHFLSLLNTDGAYSWNPPCWSFTVNTINLNPSMDK